MNEQEQIEEFQNDIIDNLFDGGTYKLAELLYDAGYRKADEVRKETAKEIIDMLIPNCEVCDENWHKGCRCLRATIAEKIAKRYGVEVDE